LLELFDNNYDVSELVNLLIDSSSIDSIVLPQHATFPIFET